MLPHFNQEIKESILTSSYELIFEFVENAGSITNDAWHDRLARINARSVPWGIGTARRDGSRLVSSSSRSSSRGSSSSATYRP